MGESLTEESNNRQRATAWWEEKSVYKALYGVTLDHKAQLGINQNAKESQPIKA